MSAARRGPLVALRALALRFRYTRAIAVRPRLLIAILASVALYFVLPSDWRLTTRLLAAWNFGAVFYFTLAIAMMIRDDHAKLRARAPTQDEGRFAILGVAIFATVASLIAIVLQLAATKDMTGGEKAIHVSLAALTIFVSWAFIHLMFALHYAHEYANEQRRRPEQKPELRGGLQFVDTTTPDYMDFLYFSYVIGVACQTADVAISSRMMRTIALAQGVVAFFFNTTVLALTINIAASLI